MSNGLIMNRKVNRPVPLMATHRYKTYRVMSPLSTHFRRATCAEAVCKAYQEGWTYKKSDLDERLLYIVTHAGKRYRETEFDNSTYLVFEPGQACFQSSTHVVPLDRPEFYYAGRGDFRSFSVRKAQVFNKPEHWTESFAEHLDTIRTEIEKG